MALLAKREKIIEMPLIADDIIATKEFHEKVSELYRLGGNGRRIFKNVQSLLGGIKEEGARAIQEFQDNQSWREPHKTVVSNTTSVRGFDL